MIAVGSDESNSAGPPSGKVKVYEYSDSIRRWQLVETFASITDPVYDIAFAPNIGLLYSSINKRKTILVLGRSYHVLAVASRDLRMITLKIAGGGKDNSNVANR